MRADERLQEVLGANANIYSAFNNTVTEKVFGKNSQFFNKVMEDGEVFNPYIHRRWLPSQYALLTDGYSTKNGIMNQYKKYYNYSYCITFAKSEVHKLYTLSVYARSAYEERVQFFTPEILGSILLDWYAAIRDELVCIENHGCRITTSYLTKKKYYMGYDFVKENKIVNGVYKTEHRRTFRKHIKMVEECVDACAKADLFEMHRTVQRLEQCFVWTPREGIGEVPAIFFDCFWKAGAYYSLKSMCMDNGHKLKELREKLDNGTTAEEFHEMYARECYIKDRMGR